MSIALLPLVTIAIPTFNRADRYLPETLQSALAQTYGNIEILVADNGSADGTEQLIRGIADPRLRYFRHPNNIGPTHNANFCLRQAKGRYFLLLHDDDLVDGDFIEACIAGAGGNFDVGIIRTGTRLINSEGRVIRERRNGAGGLPADGFFRAWFTRKTALYLCSTLFHTQKLRELGGFGSKHNYYDDVLAEVTLAARYGRIDVADVKASTRIHPGRRGYNINIKGRCEDSTQILDAMCSLTPETAPLIRRDGMRFFARSNYRRASTISSLAKRLAAYLVVFKHFDYRYPPPLRLVMTRTQTFQRIVPVLRRIKRSCLARA